MTSKRLSILGCGWLGKPLAQKLISKGYTVCGSTTSKEKLKDLEALKIKPYLIALPTSQEDNLEFWKSKKWIICFPPKIRGGEEHLFIPKIESLKPLIQEYKPQQIIYTSTTSIYQSDGELKTEVDADKSTLFYEAEQVLERFCENVDTKLIVLRLGGLMGYDRYPCKYYKQHKNIEGGDARVNYVHQDDVIATILKIVDTSVQSGVYNLVADHHPTRKEVLEACFSKMKMESPSIQSGGKKDKKVSNDKIKKAMGIELLQPNPVNFTYSI